MAYVDDLESVVRTGRCLILVGGVGTGKTHLACAIARVAIERGYCARFETVQRAQRRIKDAWRAVDTTESSVVDQFCQPDLLVLDEVGVQTGSDFEKNLIFDVINERYGSAPAILSATSIAMASSSTSDPVTDAARRRRAHVCMRLGKLPAEGVTCEQCDAAGGVYRLDCQRCCERLVLGTTLRVQGQRDAGGDSADAKRAGAQASVGCGQNGAGLGRQVRPWS